VSIATRGKAALVLVAVFLLGGVTGLTVGRMGAERDFGRMMGGPPGEARSRFRVEAMRRHLGLRDDQVTRLRAILEEAEAERDQAVGPCAKTLEDLRQRTEKRVREVLDDEQKKRFDEMQARRPHHGPPPFGGPPPPPPFGGPPPPPPR
jgi:hypothetical protein